MSSLEYDPAPIFASRLAIPSRFSYNSPMNPPSDARQNLYEQLIRFAEKTTERQQEAKQILDFVCDTPDCFERSHDTGHITGSGWLISPDGKKALLTLHRKLKRWVQPGGHADGDPDIRHVAIREAQEESGIAPITILTPEIIDVDIHAIPARPACGEKAHLHYDIRYLLRAPHEQFLLSDESDALGWFSAEEISHLTPPVDEAVLRLVRYWQNHKIAST